MRPASAIFKGTMPVIPAMRARKPAMAGKQKKGDVADAGKVKKRPDPTKNAPFKVDPESDDFATPRIDLSEDELKEQEDRRS